MKMHEFDTMNSIVDDLNVDDIEQLEQYADDCRRLGAKATYRYVTNQINHEQKVHLDIVRANLTNDWFLG